MKLQSKGSSRYLLFISHLFGLDQHSACSFHLSNSDHIAQSIVHCASLTDSHICVSTLCDPEKGWNYFCVRLAGVRG
ncbi:hypothetical protein Y032_0168g183 [Ancylostoma ceylanicum]|uniref:Uncharacterized protein n=1 Tax=Ancylostoma ceylanicum TaxID=53326 RepID=A0A016SVH2_9BILA|nr:hypothetical protein Y032_0168g183 [Ancylostoma ceylanicum]